jgi:hypothetical protein
MSTNRMIEIDIWFFSGLKLWKIDIQKFNEKTSLTVTIKEQILIALRMRYFGSIASANYES